MRQGSSILIDGVIITLPAVICAIIYVLDDNVKAELVLHYSRPDIIAMYTTNFVHYTPDHITSNLVVYFAAGFSSLLIYRKFGLEKVFRISFLSILFIVPFVCSFLSLSSLKFKTALGFSGVAFAVYGLMLSGMALRMVFDKKDEIVSLSYLLFLVIYGLLVKFYEPTSNWWAGYLFVIFPLTPAIFLIAKYRRDRMALKRIAVVVSLTCLAFSFALGGISPYIILKNVNPVAHYSGLVCGITSPYIAYPLCKR